MTNVPWSGEKENDKNGSFVHHREKWLSGDITQVPKGKNLKIMMWAAFWSTGRSRTIMVSKQGGVRCGVTTKSYLQVLDEESARFDKTYLTFMQDKAPIHTAGQIAIGWMSVT